MRTGAGRNDSHQARCVDCLPRTYIMPSSEQAEVPSKLNTTVDVPATPEIDTPAVPTKPVPRVPMQATDVAVVQLLVEQSAIASTALTVASIGAKFIPVSVTLATAEMTLCGEEAVMTGPAKQEEPRCNKTKFQTLKRKQASCPTVEAESGQSRPDHTGHRKTNGRVHAGSRRADARHRRRRRPAAG